jgi:hypothetical protein
MDEDLPRVGAHCAVRSHTGTITEYASDGRRTPFKGLVVVGMTCDPPAEAAHHEFSGATITGYGPLPKKDGGRSYTTRAVRIRTGQGEVRELYFVHGNWDESGVPIADVASHRQPYPAIGTRCDIATSASVRYRAAVPSTGPVELIYRIRC